MFGSMSNRKTHTQVGFAAGIASSLFYQASSQPVGESKIDWLEVFSCGLVGAAIAQLPDRLEPATNPNHRGFFHSITAAALVSMARSSSRNKDYPRTVKIHANAAAFGYLSHLVLDSQTPAGIEWI